MITQDGDVGDFYWWPREGGGDTRGDKVSPSTSSISQVLTVEAAVVDTKGFALSDRISRVCRHPAILEAKLVRPERGLDVAGGRGTDLAGREKEEICQNSDLVP